MSNFDPNAVIRGAQLTIVGAVRALQNPELFKYEHYRQVAIAIAAGLIIRIFIAAPIFAVRSSLWVMSSFVRLEQATWDDKLLSGLDFIAKSLLQAPFFLMSLMRYITPTLDDLFLESLRWVDYTYARRHQSDDRRTLRAMYYPNLRLYSTHGRLNTRQASWDGAQAFLRRYGRRTLTSLVVYALSFVPVLGRFVLPAASFYAFNQAAGPLPALVIFGVGVFLPRRFLVVFLQSYFASRGLMRELLEPYFSRIRFTPEQKRRWFRDREGLLFGFGVGFYLFLKIPLLGVLVYGVAEASTAYLITKITDPPPAPAYAQDFAESQTRWKNKVEFLKLPLENLDVHNISSIHNEHTSTGASSEETLKGSVENVT